MLERLFLRHLEDDEPLYMVVHKHWIYGIKDLIVPIAVAACSWGLLYIVPVRLIFYGVLLLNIAVFVWFLRNFFDYYLDAWIITDRSVIDVEWHGWFHRQSTRIDFTSIEGVSYEIQGVLGTILRYGTVTVERIGSGTTVSIDHVKKPKDVESSILACQEACIRTKNMKDSSAVKDIIAEIVAERMHIKEYAEDEYETEEEESEEEKISV